MKQCDMILDHLQNIGPLTQLEALQRYGCGRLGARIWDLRHAGFPIKARNVKVKKAIGGEATVAEYYYVRDEKADI